MEALQGSIVVKRERFLSQGGQGHWAPGTGVSRPMEGGVLEGEMEEG